MIREFAVDPEALASWERFRYVTEKFGVDQARLISAFPKDWDDRVANEIRKTKGLKLVRRHSMVNRLIELKRRKKIVSFGRPFVTGEAWKTNTVRQHAERPFHAIVAKDRWGGVDNVIVVDDAEDSHFAADRQIVVPRTAQALANAVAPLLQLSRKVYFVDPYFRPDDLRWRTPLQAFLASAVSRGSIPKQCEFHLKKFEHPLEDFAHFKNGCDRKLPRIIPKGMKLHFVRWVQIDEQGPEPGEQLHARYILTDIGGVQIESGLDEGEGKETTNIDLLTEKVWRKRLQDFVSGDPVYARADFDGQGNPLAVVVTGTWDGPFDEPIGRKQ